MKIGLYGGSFNPLHYGHVNLARRAIADLSLDELVVLPAQVSPFKTEGVPDDCALLRETRLSRIRAAFAAVGRARVDEREIARGGVSYAIDTVREFAAENPGAELFFLIGEDSEPGLPRWREIDELRRLCTFKVYARTRESSSEIRRLFAEHAVRLNPDAKMAGVVEAGVCRKNGFCPCRLEKRPEFFCPCEEFRGQLADPSFSGMCHCRLYVKGA